MIVRKFAAVAWEQPLLLNVLVCGPYSVAGIHSMKRIGTGVVSVSGPHEVYFCV